MLNFSIVSYRVHTLNIKLKTIQAYKNTQKKQEDPYSYIHTYICSYRESNMQRLGNKILFYYIPAISSAIKMIWRRNLHCRWASLKTAEKWGTESGESECTEQAHWAITCHVPQRTCRRQWHLIVVQFLLVLVPLVWEVFRQQVRWFRVLTTELNAYSAKCGYSTVPCIDLGPLSR